MKLWTFPSKTIKLDGRSANVIIINFERYWLI